VLNKCSECFEKQQKIDKLVEENQRLKAKLGREERKASEGFFGSQTPSSKIPLKKVSLEENQKKRGGGKPGHKGHGRRKITNEEADHIREIEVPNGCCCPHCHGTDLRDVESEERSVIESVPVKAEKIIYRLKGKLCLHCHKIVRAKAPSVMPKSLYGNQLATHVAVMHYLHGTPLGRLEEQLQIPYSAMVEILHRLGRVFSGVVPKLIDEYRKSPAKHADETGWRTDGGNGYAWLFATERLSIFQFRDTRSGSVPAAILGQKRLPGVLVVDRYQGYNKAPCAIQYCYAHLLRHLEDLEKEHPEREEIRIFVATVAPMLSLAMNLRNQPISDDEFYERAKTLAKQIQDVMREPAVDLGIRAYQDIFRDRRERLYHWAKDRRVPADNNLAERDLRPTVIARKVSFGSQSENGAKTRGILMSILVSLKKRYPEDYSERFKMSLDQISAQPDLDCYRALFPP
jgi:transposase